MTKTAKMALLSILSFAATVPAANWLIVNVGTECLPHGPCVIPVGFGQMAPSGVLMIAAALVLRDLVHELAGWKVAVGAVIFGGLLSLIVAPPSIAIASGAAFLLSEFADMAVYTPLRERHRPLAVLASGAVGSIVDSAAFLLIAFGSLDFLAGQVLGKIYASVAVAAILWLRRREVPA